MLQVAPRGGCSKLCEPPERTDNHTCLTIVAELNDGSWYQIKNSVKTRLKEVICNIAKAYTGQDFYQNGAISKIKSATLHVGSLFSTGGAESTTGRVECCCNGSVL